MTKTIYIKGRVYLGLWFQKETSPSLDGGMIARGRQTSRSRRFTAISQPWTPRREWRGSEARLITLNLHPQWHTSFRMADFDSTMSPNEATNWGLSIRTFSLCGDILHSNHHTQYYKEQNPNLDNCIMKKPQKLPSVRVVLQRRACLLSEASAQSAGWGRSGCILWSSLFDEV